MTVPRRVGLVGPFEHHALVIDGYEVPYVEAMPLNGGMVRLRLDGRMTLDVPVPELDGVALFLADAIAVAAGFTAHPCHGAAPVARTPYHRLSELGGD